MDLTGLGIAEPSTELLRVVCCRAVGDPAAEPLDATAGPVDHEIASIATAGLHRVTGLARTSAGTRPWSAFVKVLQHARHWSMLPMLPPDRAAELVAVFPWREELDTRAQVLPVLPDGLRVPAHYAVEDLGDDRVAVWMEDVDAVDTPWTPADYERTAYALGRLAARRTPGLPAGDSDLPAGLGVRKLVELRGPIFAATLADDAPWRAAVDAGLVDAGLRDDLARVLDLTPTVLAELDTLPTALPHGDASPVEPAPPPLRARHGRRDRLGVRLPAAAGPRPRPAPGRRGRVRRGRPGAAAGGAGDDPPGAPGRGCAGRRASGCRCARCCAAASARW